MNNPKINFLNPFEKKPRKEKSAFPKILFYPLIFLGIFILIFSIQIILSGDSVINNLEKINIFQNFGFSLSKDQLLKGETDDRINVLLLGMGGEGHPGPYLTDTILLLSLKPSENKASLISIPRDLSVPIPGYGWRKINEANHFGEMKNPGSGSQSAAAVVSNVFDIPIHYYIRLDFSGFENLINELGGLNIYVENSFTDNQFPTDDYGFQTVSFSQGWQNMDGKTALNYARSRHGTNNESSDFARSKRQQQVLRAIKDKALSFTTFLSYRKISALMDLYKNHVATNLNVWEIFKLVKLAKKVKPENISNLVLQDGPDGPLYATNINGAYLLLPKDMSFFKLQQMVKYVFEPATASEAKTVERIKIEVQNGTKIEGLAYRTYLTLKDNGYEVVKFGNAQKQNLQKTVIYDLTAGQKNAALENLKNKLEADVTTENLETISHSANIDFLIILGQNQQDLTKLE